MNIATGFKLILALSLVLTGCTALIERQSPDIFTEQTPQCEELNDDNAIGELMRYHGFLLEKKVFQLAWEYNYAKNHFKDSLDAGERLKYILLISMPNTAHTDIQAALTLLNNWPEEISLSPSLASFRKLLLALLTEQQTARNSMRNLLYKLKSTEEQAQTLQKRIDAIKSMERNPIRRITP